MLTMKSFLQICKLQLNFNTKIFRENFSRMKPVQLHQLANASRYPAFWDTSMMTADMKLELDVKFKLFSNFTTFSTFYDLIKQMKTILNFIHILMNIFIIIWVH